MLNDSSPRKELGRLSITPKLLEIEIKLSDFRNFCTLNSPCIGESVRFSLKIVVSTTAASNTLAGSMVIPNTSACSRTTARNAFVNFKLR